MKLSALKQLKTKIEEMKVYLDQVISGQLEPNPQILYNMQNIFNLIPNLQIEVSFSDQVFFCISNAYQELVKSFAVKTNDQMLVIYLASLIRSVVSLHTLISNKIQNRDDEKKKISGDKGVSSCFQFLFFFVTKPTADEGKKKEAKEKKVKEKDESSAEKKSL